MAGTSSPLRNDDRRETSLISMSVVDAAGTDMWEHAGESSSESDDEPVSPRTRLLVMASMRKPIGTDEQKSKCPIVLDGASAVHLQHLVGRF